MRKFTIKELEEIHTLSQDLRSSSMRCREIYQEDIPSDYNDSYELILNNSISLAIQTLYNKIIATHQGV